MARSRSVVSAFAEGLLDFYGNPVNPGTVCDPAEGKTVQQDVDSADINIILRRAGITDPRQVVAPDGIFWDTTELGDYRVLADRLAVVNAYFSNLPAEVRKQYANDPLVFLDEANTDEGVLKLQRLGLVEKAPPQEAPNPPVVPSP